MDFAVLRRLEAEAGAGGDPTAFFERLYTAAAAGDTAVPWDHGGPHPLLVEWAAQRHLAGGNRLGEGGDLAGEGRTSLVVGAGLGYDAEYVAGLGYDVIAFDVAPTAVAEARRRWPDSAVRYTTADLLDTPPEWHRKFDLVVESRTVQSLPRDLRSEAVGRIGDFVAPYGTLVVIASALPPDADPTTGPPWPLTRDELQRFAVGDLRPSVIELTPHPEHTDALIWRAEFTRLPVLPPPPQH